MVVWHYNWDVLLVSTNSDPITDDKTVIESGRQELKSQNSMSHS
jgi:hypothetical protein